MKTIELTTIAQPVADLLDLADAEGILLRLPNGKVFLLTSVMETMPDDNDFDEVARARQNAALMQLLRERSQERTRYSSQQVRERLGLSKQ